MIKKYDFYKTKYGEELLIDLIRLESLEKYINEGCSHVLSYYDITLITGGEGQLSINHQHYDIQSRSVYFSSPGQIRNWEINILPTGYVLIFEEEFMSCFLNDFQFVRGLKYFSPLALNPQLMLSPDENLHMVKLMEDIEQEVETFDINDKHILRALLYQILVWLNRKYIVIYPETTINNHNRHVHSFIKLVEQGIAKCQSVTYYADKLNITTGHLNDLCKYHLGISAKQYIEKKIITEVKRLLLYTDLTIGEIAFRLNFNDPSYFSRKIKLSTGKTPLAYRKEKKP